MNYIGSKFKLSSWIKEEVKKVAGEDLSEKVFCDMFAGTGIVGQTFKKDVKQVISNDLEHYSFVLNKNYIENHEDIKDKEKYIDELNNLPLIENGFIYQNYCMGSGSGRQYFSDFNGKKIDTIRIRIKELRDNKEIDSDMYYFLLASLLESADEVANTASVYEAFLKTVKKTALRELELLPAEFILNKNSHQVFNEDSNELIKKISGDILYLDPPYNQRQYSSNYHLLNTITQYDDFIPQGKTGLRDYNRSSYSKSKKVHVSFEELIKDAKFKYIFLSYNNEGLMSEDDVKNIMSRYGRYSLIKKEYKRLKTNKAEYRNNRVDKTFEYLHILEKI
jgi:adenine-specific DNA-methyltransferase